MHFNEVFQSKFFQKKLEELYGKVSPSEIDRYRALVDLHIAEVGESPRFFFSSPGRIEIVGNHTDHNAGKVLCAAVTVDTLGAVSPREDGLIVVKSKGYPAIKVSIDDLTFRVGEFGSSVAIIRGILDYFTRAGKKVGGFNAYTESTVPKGSGVSSSSAFELLIAEILNVMYNDGELDAVFKAKASQYAESVYFGKPCGLMDQSAIALGGVNLIDFRDFESPVIEQGNWCFDDLDIYVIATGGDHCDLTADYAAIPAEMKMVAKALDGKLLRDVEPAVFYQKKQELSSILSPRALLRAEHYFEENTRVEQAFKAVCDGDENAFIKAVNESGESSKNKLQNLYSPCGGSHALERALELVGEVDGVLAKRVHGGGFAGTILVFVKKDRSSIAKQQINHIFGENNVFILSIRPDGAIKVI